jgi:IAA-amino acid hydrolase
LRRKFHQCPELKFAETSTSQLIRETLDSLNIPLKHPVGVTGVVAQLGNGKEPCTALRADMDALPVSEDNEFAFKSRNPGKMHACGHDCHIAMLLGAARILKARESEINGTIKLFFQPGEEGGAGADLLCKEGALENPEVSSIFALHCWPTVPRGKIAGNSGPIMAAVSNFSVKVQGKGGHGALPHHCIDPLTSAAKMILELQTIVSREMNPFSPSVLTIGSIKGGIAANVIPEKVTFSGTIRSLSIDGAQHIRKRLVEIVESIAVANRCRVSVSSLMPDYPATVNDEGCWQIARQAATELLGAQNVVRADPVMIGEDFAYYQQLVPGCLAFLGVSKPGNKDQCGLHHPRFNVDESALPIGSAWHVSVALAALAKAANQTNHGETK